jgi:formate dehydrogenase
VNAKYHATVEDMVKVCDIITINCPLHPGEHEHEHAWPWPASLLP